MTFAEKAIKYFCSLKIHKLKNPDVELLNTYQSADVKEAVKKFYQKFYSDNNRRLFIIGINPGRFGGGLTGISFTDPVALKEHCGIDNNLGERKEISSKFIYEVAEQFGGVKEFFSNVFLTAAYPFALIKNGKNYNYYDDKILANNLHDQILRNIKSQLAFSSAVDSAIILGKKNADYISAINIDNQLFKKIIVLEHPRFIMQYRLRSRHKFIAKYLETIKIFSK
jgi:hypothetical protein